MESLLLIALAFAALIARAAAADSTVLVNLAGTRQPVSPLIYGVNDKPVDDVSYPMIRYGGNRWSLYNWQNDSTNVGLDYFFLTVPNDDSDPTNLPDKSSLNNYLDWAIGNSSQPVITVPMTGWVAKSRDVAWSCDTQEFPNQTQNECDVADASYCRPHAGSCLLSTNPDVFVPWNSDIPLRANMPVNESYIGAWVDYLRQQRHSNAALFYSMDNEPILWDSTHWDVHHNATSLDELWEKTVRYGAVVKQHDPTATIMGPVTWGYCDLFWSAVDNCGGSNVDRSAHDDLPLLKWYMGQVCDYYQQTGVRLVDYIDVHWYPQGGEPLNANSGLDELRLRSIQELYSTTYIPENWIASANGNQSVALIPLIKGWIQDTCPWLKLSISEYDWGYTYAAQLAQAEIFSIFARYGVDMASRWAYGDATSPRKRDAFELYLNYDGQGSKIAGEAVYVNSSNPMVGAYGVLNPVTKQLFVLLFNKDIVAQTVQLTIIDSVDFTTPTSPSKAQHYYFDENNALAATDDVAWDPQTGVRVVLPLRSAHLLVFPSS